MPFGVAIRSWAAWRTRHRAAVVVGAVALVVAPTLARALHTKTPPVLQVTTAPGQVVGEPRFSPGHNILVFHSDGDLLGNGNTVPQVFLFEVGARVTGKKRPGLFQLTFGDQPSLAPTAASRGRVVAFHTTDDPNETGSVGRQIFASRKIKWRKGDVAFMQLTRGSSESFDPILTGTGRYLFFTSTGDLTQQNVPAGEHLYRSELRAFEKSRCPGYPCPLGAPGLMLVSPEIASHPAPNKTGTRVVFESAGDAAQNGCVNGATQLFMRDFARGVTEQLTFGLRDSRNPVFTQDGKQIFFDSAADLVGNGNARRNIFMVDLARDPFGGVRPVTQITFGTDGDTYDPAPSGKGGERLFLKSTAGFANATPGVERLLHFEASTNRYIRLTDGEPVLSPLTSQFTFTAFASTADYTGQNPSGGAQTFLVNAFPLLDLVPQPTGTPQGTPTPTATPTPLPDPCSGQPDATSCDDGNPCTAGEVCTGGVCGGGTPTTCPDDGNPCTTDVCNTATGSCGVPQLCVCP